MTLSQCSFHSCLCLWFEKSSQECNWRSRAQSLPLFSSHLIASLQERVYVCMDNQSVCPSSFQISRLELCIMVQSALKKSEPMERGTWTGPWSIWMGNSGFLTPGRWSWNGGMSSVSPTLLDPCFSGHLRVGVENWPQKHCERIQKWERKRKKPTESGLIRTLLLWTPRAQPQGKLSKRLCGMHLRIIPLWDKKLGT